MTATLAETTTTTSESGKYEDLRLAALRRVGGIDDAAGSSWIIAPGYSVRTAQVPRAGAGLLVTEVSAANTDTSEADLDRLRSKFLGRLVFTTGPGSNGRSVYQHSDYGPIIMDGGPATHGRPNIVRGETPLVVGDLVGFRYGGVAEVVTDPGASPRCLQMVHENPRVTTALGLPPAEPGAMVSLDRDHWVRLTRDADDAPAGDYPLPDGWEYVASDPAGRDRSMPRWFELFIHGPQPEGAEVPDALGKTVNTRTSEATGRYFVQDDAVNQGSPFFAHGSEVRKAVLSGGYLLTRDGRLLSPSYISAATGTLCGTVDPATGVADDSGLVSLTNGDRWVEVRRTLTAPAPGALSEEERLYVADHVTTPADQQVALNMPLEDGKLYLFWSARQPMGSSTEKYLYRVAGDKLWLVYSFSHRGTERRYYTRLADMVANKDGFTDGGWFWAEAAEVERPASTTPVNSDSLPYTTALSRLHSRWEEWGEKLNELAEDNSWCSEYEGIVRRLGLPGRSAEKKDLSVQVSVNFTITVPSPSGHVDSEVEDMFFEGNSVSLTEVTMEGTATVHVDVDDVSFEDGDPDYSDLADRIDSDDVQDALENSLTNGASVSDIGDWNVEGWEERD